jgi:repressor LexA
VKGLTKRQREIVDYIRDYIAVHKYSPSYREIMKYFGFTSLGSVYKHIAVLKRKGVLSAEKASARSVTLTQEEQNATPSNSIELPFLGYIAAGMPIETFPQAGKVTVPVSMVSDASRSYVLEVTGDSMIDDGIRDGDKIVVEARDTANAGQTIVALVEGTQTTLKRFYNDAGQGNFRLVPANKNLESVIVSAAQLKIHGIVKGLVREYE